MLFRFVIVRSSRAEELEVSGEVGVERFAPRTSSTDPVHSFLGVNQHAETGVPRSCKVWDLPVLGIRPRNDHFDKNLVIIWLRDWALNNLDGRPCQIDYLFHDFQFGC